MAIQNELKRTAHDELKDEDLLRLSQKGDEESFLVLYRRHQGAVFRFSLHMSGRIDAAEEVTQDVFLTLLGQPKGYSPERGSLQGYLIGVARNKLRGHLREAKRYAPADEAHEPAGDLGDDLISRLSRAQELSGLREMILSLPDKYREVIALCDLEGLDYARAAEFLRCPVGTVRSRLNRARTILGAKVRKERCMA